MQKAVEIIPFGTVNFNFTQLNIYSNTESNTISGIPTDYTQYSLNSFPNIIFDFGAYIGFRYASFTNGNFNNHFGIKIGMFASLKDNFRLNLNKTLTTSYNFIGFNVGIYNRF